jgi:hypothetical protein
MVMTGKKPAPKKAPETEAENAADKKPASEKPPIETNSRKPIETLENVKADVQSGAATAKKPTAKRGRPKKEEPPPPPELNLDVESIKLGVNTLFEIIAARRGSHWSLRPEESENLALSIDAVARKYFPMFANWAEEINLIGVSIMLFGPRLYMEYQLIKYRKGQEIDAKPVTE